MSEIINSLNWRYATKKFDSSKKLSKKELDELLEVLRLTPSSYGLQPWEFLVINNKEIREKIQKAAWDQPQVTEASNLIVLCVKTNIDSHYIQKYIQFLEKENSLKEGTLKSMEDMLLNAITSQSPEKVIDWSKKQVYIALGNILTSCAINKIDACPMEGFNSEEVDKILNLKSKHLASVILYPVGHRSKEDKYASKKKIRFPKNELIKQID